MGRKRGGKGENSSLGSFVKIFKHFHPEQDMFYYGLEKKSLEYTHLKCEICTFWSDNFRSMKYHLAQYHKVDVANVGDFCIYVQHYMISTQTKFRCRRCRYFVPSRKAMENHILWNHNIRVSPRLLANILSTEN